MAPPADAVLAFVSGFPLILLGAMLLWIRPWRSAQVLFGVFAVLWGLQIVTVGWGRVFRDADSQATKLLVSHVFMVVATLFLVHFAARLRPHRLDWIPTMVFGAFAGAAFLAYIIDPSLIVESVVVGQDGLYSTSYGALITPLVHVPFFAAFVVSIVLLHNQYRRARPGTGRHRLRGILMALLLFVSYQFVRNTLAYVDLVGGYARFAAGSVRAGSDLSSTLLVVSFTAGTLVLLAVVVHAFARPPPPENRDLPLLLAFLFPAAIGVLEFGLQKAGVVTLDTLGFWRLVSVGVLVFTLANYQLFDLDIKIKRYAGQGTAAVLVLFGIPVALGMAQGDFGIQAVGITLLPEVIAVGAVLIFRERIGERLFPGAQASGDYTQQRKLELYKVALEDALGRGQDPEGAEMRALRTRYGVSDHEHRLILWMTERRQGGPSIDLTPGSVILERYQIMRLLGEGTHRATYLATDLKSHQLVAVKAVRTDELDGAAARLLVREARLAASIAHPNVLSVFDVAETEAVAVIIMDYADQGNLEDHLKNTGPLGLSDAVRFLTELLSGLGAIHARGIVHRNLKPKNVLIDADGSVLISDLSAARADDPTTEVDERLVAPADEAEAIASEALLDLLYLSPEQASGQAAGPASDLFSAAVLFHRALTNHHYLPIAGRSDVQIRHLIRTQAPVLQLRDEPAWLRPFLERALARDPAKRFQDAMAMLEELRRQAGVRRAAPTAA